MFARVSMVENPARHCACFDIFISSHYLLRDSHEKNFKAFGIKRDCRTVNGPLRLLKTVE